MKIGLLVLFLLLLPATVLAARQTPQKPNAGERKAGGLANGEFMAFVNGFHIHYQVRGRGPACIALTNSWGLTGEGVRAVLRALEDRLTIIYFDPRGMGKSDAVVVDADMSMKAVREDANALRAHLKLDKAIFIGWSNGAANLMMFAAEYPETVRAAIMLHGLAYFAPEEIEPLAKKYPDLFQRFGKYQQEMSTSTLPAAEKNKKVKQFDLEVWFPFLFADPKAGRARLKELFAPAEFSYKHALYSNAEQQSFDARPSLPKIKAPTLVIAGAHDMMPPEKVKPVADAIPNSKFVIFENSGHFSPVEEQDKFVDVVISFLRLEK